MDKPVSKDTEGRPLANEGLLLTLVERLTERGIIRPEEADDMLALLAAFSEQPLPSPSPVRAEEALGKTAMKAAARHRQSVTARRTPSRRSF
ncbi:hypothetical protein [Gellertiella hungarica]|uniref:Uncharacterized protein n=1 Tax=Gellertiella hungarica TaxID=1572859 RepID=A0A7W6J9G1_9HYPH|nr:hypothetical protein [Gellertiella hungarica]MBB4067212.1 hypothetical protein [Gellertiella hungarica]